MYVQFCKTKTKAQSIAAGNDGQIYFPTDEDCIVMGGKVYAHANAGTITGVTMNGSSKGTSGVVDLGNVITPSNIHQNAAYQITLAGTPYEHSNGIIIITGANLISAIGNSPVARATSDASGHGIEATYATKGELAAKQDAIQDLAAIRTNAQKALTAVQPTAISDMATKTWISSQQYATVAQFNPAGGAGVVNVEEDYVFRISLAGTTYNPSNGTITITAANLIAAIGNSPVARATADASGNAIATTYVKFNDLGNSSDRSDFEDAFGGTISILKAITQLHETAQHITVDSALSSSSTNPAR